MREAELPHAKGALPKMDNPVVKPLNQIRPIVPTIAKQNPIGIPWDISKRTAPIARIPMRITSKFKAPLLWFTFR
jgi:hypothetical protein